MISKIILLLIFLSFSPSTCVQVGSFSLGDNIGRMKNKIETNLKKFSSSNYQKTSLPSSTTSSPVTFPLSPSISSQKKSLFINNYKNNSPISFNSLKSSLKSTSSSFSTAIKSSLYSSSLSPSSSLSSTNSSTSSMNSISTNTNSILQYMGTKLYFNKLSILSLLFYASWGSFFPFLSLYYVKKNISPINLGYLGSISPLISFISSPLWGFLSDYYHIPYEILISSYILTLLLRFLLYYLNFSIKNLIYYLIIISFFNTPIKPLLDTLLLNNILIKNNKKLYGILRVYGQIGFGLGSFLSSFYLLNNNIEMIFVIQLLIGLPTLFLMMKLLNNNDISNPINNILEKKNKKLINLLSIKLFIIKLYNKILHHKSSSFSSSSDSTNNSSSTSYPSTITTSAPSSVSSSILYDSKKSYVKNLLTTLCRGEVLLFFVLVLILGLNSGIIENFANERVKEIISDYTTSLSSLISSESTSSLSDVSSAVASVSTSSSSPTKNYFGLFRLSSSLIGIPFFLYSNNILNYFGIHPLLCFIIFSYYIRFIFYSYIKNPSWLLLPEILRGVIISNFSAGSTYYINSISPNELKATMVNFLNQFLFFIIYNTLFLL